MRPLIWADFLSIVEKKILAPQFRESGGEYHLVANDGPHEYRCVLYASDISEGATYPQGYSAAQNDADCTVFESVYKDQWNARVDRRRLDRAQVVSFEQYPKGVYAQISGRGDTSGVRGDGTWMRISATAQGDAAPVDCFFRDPCYLVGGQLFTYESDFGDSLTMDVVIPASTVEATTPGTGDCILYPVGPGINMIIPHPTGTHNVLTKIPVPWGDDYWDPTPGGSFWKVTASEESDALPIEGPGFIRSATTIVDGQPVGHGRFNLFDFPIPVIRHVCSMPVPPAGTVLDLSPPNVAAKLILPQWIIRVKLNKTDAGSTKIAWFLHTGRAKTS